MGQVFRVRSRLALLQTTGDIRGGACKSAVYNAKTPPCRSAYQLNVNKRQSSDAIFQRLTEQKGEKPEL